MTNEATGMQAALTMIQAYRAHHDGRMLVVDAGVRDRATTLVQRHWLPSAFGGIQARPP